MCALLAAILAHGCNLGLYTMEKVAPDIAYRRLKYVSDWRLVEENQRAALAAIVHGISRLDAAGHWGDGTTSASDGQRFAMPHKVLQRLNRFQASNRFYAANRELGRALKTEFVLQYMSEPQLRAKVRRGLLKVEQLHALARAVYYGQRGRISAREVYDQMNACSCLTLILACIVYWQAREISRLAAAPDFPFDPDLLRHVSPIEWKNVILYGEIKIDPAKLKTRRP